MKLVMVGIERNKITPMAPIIIPIIIPLVPLI